MSLRDSASSGPKAHPGHRRGGRQPLPPIRIVLGEQLALSPLHSSRSPNSAASRGSPYLSTWELLERSETLRDSSSPSSGGRTGDSQRQPLSRAPGALTPSATQEWSPLAREADTFASTTPSGHSLSPSPSPFVPDSLPSHSGQAGASYDDAPSSLFLPLARPVPPKSPPPFSYNVLRPSPSGVLITAPSVSRARTRRRTGTSAASRVPPVPETSTQAGEAVNARRHVCPMCEKRFNRPSSLKIHQSVHTGSRPFQCTYPGCRKIFSVASNMRRHLRTRHGGGGDGHRGENSTGVPNTELEPDQDPPLSGSSDGDVAPPLEEPPAGVVLTTTSPLLPSRLPDPGLYLKWTTTARPAPGDEPNATDAYPG